MTISMAIALTKTCQKGHKLIAISRQLRKMKKAKEMTLNQKTATIKRNPVTNRLQKKMTMTDMKGSLSYIMT